MRFQWPTFSVRVPIHGLVVLGLALWFAACGFEPENRCSPDQIFNDEINVCVCPPGTMTVDRACISCPSNEKVVGGQCVCADGLQRGPNGVCAQGIPGLAESCVPGGSATCSNPVYPSCNPSSAGGGYCTSSGCSNDANCPAGFTCATWASPSYCMRPPTGVGKACASPGDCAGLEASYCESQIAKSCLVSGCDLALKNCQTGFVCCDVSAYGIADNLCVPMGLCP